MRELRQDPEAARKFRDGVAWLAGLARSCNLAIGTKATYQHNQQGFLNYCDLLHIDPLEIDEDELCMVGVAFCIHHSVTGLAPFMSAVQNLFYQVGGGDLPRNRRWQATFRGLRRLLGAADEPVRTRALSLDDVAAMVHTLDLRSPSDVCFGSQLLTAFFFALRTNEHCGGRIILGDLSYATDGSVVLRVAPTKNNSAYRSVGCAKRDDGLDLLCWLRILFHMLPHHRRRPRDPVFVDFCKPGLPPVSQQAFIARLKDSVQRTLGRHPALFSGYSLRRGFVTEMISRHVPLPVTAEHVGWKAGSATILKYYDHAGRREIFMPTQALAP